ncbi:unnamed protein product [Vitrella brassicaformis CCMP3155]|uniref:Uncharacterized protein n=1 Tax=Vitrella brassicaformis (strain CCMP3155) TaxID=1169540 RepID=A0A0G4EYU9_VITBC|nr:unnamed protein product [Vitrella brassicaformis CCMP3155]|eukprot:CEM03630.1 unnamed protein product [Vitrella brassicaformis CCMP3155]
MAVMGAIGQDQSRSGDSVVRIRGGAASARPAVPHRTQLQPHHTHQTPTPSPTPLTERGTLRSTAHQTSPPPSPLPPFSSRQHTGWSTPSVAVGGS